MFSLKYYSNICQFWLFITNGIKMYTNYIEKFNDFNIYIRSVSIYLTCMAIDISHFDEVVPLLYSWDYDWRKSRLILLCSSFFSFFFASYVYLIPTEWFICCFVLINNIFIYLLELKQTWLGETFFPIFWSYKKRNKKKNTNPHHKVHFRYKIITMAIII